MTEPDTGPADFLELLDLDEIAADLFIGRSPLAGRQRVYGGQVVAQALEAAYRTLTVEDHHVHSLHGYFIRSGDESRPIVYDVDRIRDGRSFSTRNVVARQAGGAIFNLSASFHRDEPDAEFTLPEVDDVDIPPPEECEEERWDEISPVRVVPDLPPGRSAVWCRIVAPDRLPEDRRLHAIAVAYASDHSPMSAIRRGHPDAEPGFDQFMGASLDHSVWFHRPARADEWLLFDNRLQSLRGSRGVAHGTIRTMDGVLVATLAQEGLLRRLAP